MSSDGSDDHHHPRPWETVRRGLLLLISSPSGAGKTSLSRRLVADHSFWTIPQMNRFLVERAVHGEKITDVVRSEAHRGGLVLALFPSLDDAVRWAVRE